jgi:hypothetical protein
VTQSALTIAEIKGLTERLNGLLAKARRKGVRPTVLVSRTRAGASQVHVTFEIVERSDS